MGSRRRRRRFSIANLPAAIFLTIAGLALAVLVVATALIASFSPRFALAASFAPDHPDIAFRVASAEYAASGGRASPAMHAQMARAAAADPLAADPYFYRAAEAIEQGRPEAATALLLEARRRNPRHRLTRLMLVERYLRSNRIGDAAEEITVLARLLPDTSELLIGQLARLAVDPATRGAVTAALAGDPLGEDVLEQLARQDADPAVILQLARNHPPRTGTEPPAWQGLLVDSLVRRGRIDDANRLWSQFSGAPGQGRPVPYDADFRGLPGTPPFNWQFYENETGTAERGRDGRLVVDYFGRNSGVLASQLVQLAPGRYRLSLQAEGNATGDGSRIVWRVFCLNTETPLMELPVVEVGAAPKPFRGEFTVPATGCPAQWLRLDGVSAEFPTTQSVEIRNLRVQPAGGAA